MGGNQSRTVDHRMDHCGGYTRFQRSSQSHSKCRLNNQQKKLLANTNWLPPPQTALFASWFTCESRHGYQNDTRGFHLN